MPEVVASNAREAAAALLKGTVMVFKSPRGLLDPKAYALLWDEAQRRLFEFYEGDASLSPTSFRALERRSSFTSGKLSPDYSRLPYGLSVLVRSYAPTDPFDDEAFANFVITHELLNS